MDMATLHFLALIAQFCYVFTKANTDSHAWRFERTLNSNARWNSKTLQMGILTEHIIKSWKQNGKRASLIHPSVPLRLSNARECLHAILNFSLR